WVLSATNTYTGTTTISQGTLRLATATALTGGLGALNSGNTLPNPNLTTTNTGGSSLIFNGTGTNNTVLELTAASGNFYRGVGAGFDQVQWTAAANGGFSANGADMVVNLGGSATPTSLVWASTAGFVGTGNLILASATG